MMPRRSFLITIDTEGDNLWAKPREILTRNVGFIPRFQSLCEAHGLKPTYLTNHEVAMDDRFREFARDALARGQAEVGMHLHAWNSPPERPLTSDDYTHQPYLIEYPPEAMREKIARLTDLLEDVFGTKMLSHRAGRWAFNAPYAAMLLERGYRVDCSVTPGVSWRGHKGAPNGPGGSDFRQAPLRAYRMAPDDVSREGASGLLEIPMTIMPCRSALASRARRWFRPGSLPRRVVDKLCPAATWLRPTGTNLKRMLGVLAWARRQGLDYVEFMLHSSEFMPGGSPTFVSERDVEVLYADLEALFAEAVAAGFTGATLSDYRNEFDAARGGSGVTR